MNKISKYAAVIALFSFIACSKTGKLSETSTTINNKQAENICSVSFENTNYKIDTALIQTAFYKLSLIAGLEADNLSEVKLVNDIPDFIKAFLNNTSCKGKFEMANPTEEWQSGITSFGHQVIKKIYDTAKKDTVWNVSYDGKPLLKKQLAYFGIGKTYALLTYYTGGINTSQHVALFKFKDNRIVDFWFDNNIETGNSEREIIKYIKAPHTNRNRC